MMTLNVENSTSSAWFSFRSDKKNNYQENNFYEEKTKDF